MAEQLFEPDWFSKPGDTLAALMAKRDLTVRELADKVGRPCDHIRLLLAGIADMDTELATQLARWVGGSQSFWDKRQATYKKALDRAVEAVPRDTAIAWLKNFPLKQMREFGWIEETSGRVDAIRSCLAYFGVTGPSEWEERYSKFEDSLLRNSRTHDTKVGALSAWLRQGEIEASLVRCVDWSPSELRNQLPELRKLTKTKDVHHFLPRLRSLCAAVGVALVFVRSPVGCPTSGAARFIAPNKAMVILSFRFLSDDQVWFTFFHEIGHLLLHGNSFTFVDGASPSSTGRELEANAFAAGVLIPNERREELMSLRINAKTIIRFAVSVGVCPGIVVGQLQHLGLIGPHQFNSLKRRYDWDEVTTAFAA